ncbi:MAG: DUF3120 domain-containing protein [Oscillatoriales cyanobacterium RM2_1_1]|nr:DUF3120 domain-containing protein [Oscillatoriales cyanobacterium SM2_3_0]NJO45007.1 DUF3120 domain-containing protein [Oscillatoriales cyanobacterium RM2_1_1]
MLNLIRPESIVSSIQSAWPKRGAGFQVSWRSISQPWGVFLGAVFLVSVPVFFQAPLVRIWPELSLVFTINWFIISFLLLRNPKTHVWGDLLLGFTWSWLAGSVYWGWLRWEPLWHLPVEAIGVPFAIWYLSRGQGKIGHWFYLGSLFGTAVTDGYFYLMDLIPNWRQLMQVDASLALPIFQNALEKISTPWGGLWAIEFVAILLAVGLAGLQSDRLHWRAFSGAVLSTILVDSLFLVAAMFA